MTNQEVSISKGDLVLVIAGAVGILIILLCVYGLFFSPLAVEKFDKDKASAFKDLFDVVVRQTLLSIFTTLISAKIGYSIAKFAITKLIERRSSAT